eukprot:4002540-Amphidinium_carterae.1
MQLSEAVLLFSPKDFEHHALVSVIYDITHSKAKTCSDSLQCCCSACEQPKELIGQSFFHHNEVHNGRFSRHLDNHRCNLNYLSSRLSCTKTSSAQQTAAGTIRPCSCGLQEVSA